MDLFETRESAVRSYCRSFPAVFDRALGAELFAEGGARYLDFFSGAGALNYGHNDPAIRARLVDYLAREHVVHALDMMTTQKRALLAAIEAHLLGPRGLDYKVQFPGPTGTNCVEAALKLARKVTGRTMVVSFTNGFHGMTLGALSVTGNLAKRAGAGVPLTHTRVLPFDGYLDTTSDTIELFERMLADGSSGLDLPAAVILETVQAEGGVRCARPDWLRRVREVCTRHGILVIADEIQVGCGRTGPFFSFEGTGLDPDLICLSKSLSGYGLPLSMLLLRPEHDVWLPGEHNGTFRGFNLAFAGAAAALELYWQDDTLSRGVIARGERVGHALDTAAAMLPGDVADVRGVGLIWGLELPEGMATQVSRRAFELGLIVETAGPRDEVLKLLPPLTIPDAQLDEGLYLVLTAMRDVVRSWPHGGVQAKAVLA